MSTAEQVRALLQALLEEGYLEQTAALLRPMARSQPDNDSSRGGGSLALHPPVPTSAVQRVAAGAAAAAGVVPGALVEPAPP